MTPPSTHTQQTLFWLVYLRAGALSGGLCRSLEDSDFCSETLTSFLLITHAEKTLDIKQTFCSHTCVWQGARDPKGQKELLLLGVAPSHCSLQRSLVSHKAVSFLLEAAAQKIYHTLKLVAEHVDIPASAPATFQDLGFLLAAFACVEKHLKYSFKSPEGGRVFMCQNI